MLFDKLQEDLRQAQLNREVVKVATLRLLLSELKYAQIEKNRDLQEEEIISITSREVKKRKESISAFKQGNREDLVSKEEAEIKVLKLYLPEQLSDEELIKIVEDAISETGATNITQMGQVIGKVMGKVIGKAEGARVSSLVKERLQNG